MTRSVPGTVTRAAVLGSPIAHSLSPYLHRAAYEALGLDGWSYEAIECDEAALPALLGGLGPGWAGLSLTMPLKRAVLPLLDTVSDLAVEVGGANTVVLSGSGRHGDNTDVYGIVQALSEAGVAPPRSAVILGGGATAASTLAALRELGLGEATLVVRDQARAGETAEVAERLGTALTVQTFDKLDAVLDVDLVVSTLPSGAADGFADLVAARAPAVFDVVYAPWPTLLAQAVRRAGGTVVGGFPMLLHQAVRQVELMTGRTDVPVEAMRAAGEAEILRRAGRAS
ncbi:shikimate 5-dehydrogenase [Planomonospora parontospora subsp. parontospora]|uniref:Shikimate 5-dehydrogenase n=2 Tax=Planomonospora parontospora TaxID=58119 RepID=A0AA37BM11_9ACTN|nr:shikimate dehydrogenase [Planomonospora parontospora]GGK91670.1 shikimate 5-dehydrogenase [Planomonospora parontospora]GII11195.1 shikimate 5-dehydrogenase [Planomonospora parontospora subsp. parontospora]